MGKQLTLIGGGHAHLVTLSNLSRIRKKGHCIAVIAPSDYHYYSGMGPGMLSKMYTPDEIRFNTRRMVESQGAQFIKAHAVKIDPNAQTVFLDNGEQQHYDVLSLNSGSLVPAMHQNGIKEGVYSVKPIESLLPLQAHILRLSNSQTARIGVIGGGPAALELSGNIWRLGRDHGKHMPRIMVFAGRKFMGHFSSSIRKHAMRSLAERDIEINENGYVKAITDTRITLKNNEIHALDIICFAHGVKPKPIFSADDLPLGPDGGLSVNRFLQSIAHANIFGGGDCIHFDDQPLDKVGVYAVRQNPILYHNIVATLEGRPLKGFDPGGDYLLAFNLGDQTGIIQKKGFVYKGRIAFFIKDYIDRKFMQKFQQAF